MAVLFDYLQQTQRMLRDSNQTLVNPQDLIVYINQARRMVARQAECIRVVPPVSGQVITITVTNPGSGYTNPTVVISGPDFPSGAKIYPNGAQATATATQVGGHITNVGVVFGGDGYFQPTATISDPTGTGATLTVQTSPINITQQGQEFYNFSDVPLQNFPGVKQIIFVRSVAFIYANWRYMTLTYSWTEYQAKIRRYPFNYEYVPAVVAQLGQGTAGSLAMYPVPNGSWQMEWDCICDPLDLVDNTSVEAIPDPWTDAVPFLAAYYAFNELQNLNAARYYKQEFDDFLSRYSASTRRGRIPNVYGRY